MDDQAADGIARPGGMGSTEVRSLDERERHWVKAFITEHWGAAIVVAHGTVYHPHELSGFVAFRGDVPVGLVTYHLAGGDCEIVTIDSLRSNQGIGTLLLDAVRDEARRSGCRRLWLITTNDNLNALRFYQKRGLRLVAVHRDAVHRARLIKPEIPAFGDDGIPIQDEIEVEQRILDPHAPGAGPGD